MAALALAAVADSVVPWSLVVALLLAPPWLLWPRRVPDWRLRLSGDGLLELERGEGPANTARASFISRHLIVLACGDRSVVLWPDTLSPAHFRQVSAYVRWPSQARAARGGPHDLP